MDHKNQTTILNHQDRGFLNITLGRVSKTIQKNRTGFSSSAFRRNSNSRSPRRPLSISSHSPSVNRRVNFDKEIVCYQCNRKWHTKSNCRDCWPCGSCSLTKKLSTSKHVIQRNNIESSFGLPCLLNDTTGSNIRDLIPPHTS